MNEQEIEQFINLFKNLYGWNLYARCGNGKQDYDTYTYKYVDDANICITINPVNKNFSFSKNVDFLFELKSNAFSPLDHPGHFEKFYLKFRNIVLDKGLN